MKAFIAFFSVILCSSLWASDLPVNLLRFNSGALPMIAQGTHPWVAVSPQFVDWDTNAASILAGNIGKTVKLSADSSRTYMVDLGTSRLINRVSLYSQSATGSLNVYAAEVFAGEKATQWDLVGTIQLKPQSASAIPTLSQDRFLKFVFSDDATGEIRSMGVFGKLTFADVIPAQQLQSTLGESSPYTFNYATPATGLQIVGSTPVYTAEQLMALFDDNPETIFDAASPISIVIDLGQSLDIESMDLGQSANGAALVVYGDSLKDILNKTQSESASSLPGMTPFKHIGGKGVASARFVKITLNDHPQLEGISLRGPILPDALVYESMTPRMPTQTFAQPKKAQLPTVSPILPRVISQGGN